MIPLRDENPTQRPAVMTVLLIVACVVVFLLVQPDASRAVVDTPDQRELIDEIEFTYEYAAIPCELVQGRPLTVPEIARTVGRGDTESCADGAVPAGVRTAFPDKSVWGAVVISMFLHADWIHLIGNMVFLWVFGNNIEDHLGVVKYALFYLAAGVVATAAHVGLQLDSTVPLVGASGAIAGVMGAYLVWFPWARIRTLLFIGFIPLWPRLPAWAPLAIWFVVQFFTAPDAGIAWAAHVCGFVFGVVVAWWVRRDPRFRRRLWTHRHRTTGTGAWDNRSGPTAARPVPPG